MLIELAGEADLNIGQFMQDLNSNETHTQLQADIALGQKLGAQGFPSMVLLNNGSARTLNLDYNSFKNILKQII